MTHFNPLHIGEAFELINELRYLIDSNQMKLSQVVETVTLIDELYLSIQQITEGEADGFANFYPLVNSLGLTLKNNK